MILQFIKTIVNIVVHGYTLHTVYGLSVRLLEALFGSITLLLVHLNERPAPVTYKPYVKKEECGV